MIALLILAAAANTPREAIVLSSVETGDFVKDCEGKPSDLTSNFCVGYIMGAYDALTVDHKGCAPTAKATTIAAVAATRKYLSDHPEQWSQATIFIVRRALQTVFPCR